MSGSEYIKTINSHFHHTIHVDREEIKRDHHSSQSQQPCCVLSSPHPPLCRRPKLQSVTPLKLNTRIRETWEGQPITLRCVIEFETECISLAHSTGMHRLALTQVIFIDHPSQTQHWHSKGNKNISPTFKVLPVGRGRQSYKDRIVLERIRKLSLKKYLLGCSRLLDVRSSPSLVVFFVCLFVCLFVFAFFFFSSLTFGVSTCVV